MRIALAALMIATVSRSVAVAAQDAPPPATAAIAAPASEADKMICRATAETGSLIKQHKVCLTRKQWTSLNNENSSAARRIVENNPGGYRPN